MNTRSGYLPVFLVIAIFLFGPLLSSLAVANDQPFSPLFSPDRPNETTFEPVDCRYVRIVIHETARGPAPAIDALEIFGEDGKTDLAASKLGALATASSVLKGHRSYQISHLNNGLYGSQNCWIADTNDTRAMGANSLGQSV